MKKFVFLLLLLLVVVPSCFALSTDIKESYSASETVLVKVSGNILSPITSSMVQIKRGHVALPVEYDVKLINGSYYIWFIAPENNGNYSLFLKDVETPQSGSPVKIDYESNFTVGLNNISKSDYYVKPGFIYTTSNFILNVYLNGDEEVIIPTGIPVKDTVIKPGNNELKFSIGDIGQGLFNMQVGKYFVPVYIYSNSSVIKTQTEGLRFNPQILESITTKNNRNAYPFAIANLGSNEINKISLEYDHSKFDVSPDEIFSLRGGEIAQFNLTIKGDQDVRDFVYARYSGRTSEMTVDIGFTNDVNKVDTPYIKEGFNNNAIYYCSELNGAICASSESCSGEEVDSIDGVCCIGICQTGGSSGYGWIGWLLLGILIVGGAIVWIKYKKVKTDKNPLKKKIEEAEKKGP